MSPADGQVDRTRTLLGTGGSVFVIILLVVGVGVAWRQPVSETSRSNSFGSVARDTAPPAWVFIDEGLTTAELAADLVDAGIARAEALPSILANPSTVDLPPALASVDHLAGFLAAGRYDITPTTDAETLVEQMVIRFAASLDAELIDRIAIDGRSLTDVVRIAGAASELATARSELPLAAGMLWNLPVPTTTRIAVLDADAVTAAAYPATTTATEWHHDSGGDLRLGPPLVSSVDPSTELASQLVVRIFENAQARASIVAIDPDGDPVVSVHARRHVELASVYKLAVLAVTLDEVQRGRLELRAPLVEQLGLVDSGIDETLTLDEALTTMIVTSDNATAIALLNGIGSDEINDRLRSWGIEEFSVGSKPQIATAHGVAQLLAEIRSGDHLGLGVRSYAMSLLQSTDQDDRLAALVDGTVAHKTGDLDTVVNDAGIFEVRGESIIAVALTEEIQVRRTADLAISNYAEFLVNYRGDYVRAVETVEADEIDGCSIPSPGNDGPLHDLHIAIDPGHGGADPGALGPGPDGETLYEADLTMLAAARLATELTGLGAQVFLTRCDDTGLTQTQRAALINEAGPDLVVSLHIDGSTEPEHNASSVLYLDRCAITLAESILGTDDQPGMWAALNAEIPLANAGVIRRTVGVLPFVLAPGVLTEPVMLTNPTEAEALADTTESDDTRLGIIVSSHVDGIVGWWTTPATDRLPMVEAPNGERVDVTC